MSYNSKMKRAPSDLIVGLATERGRKTSFYVTDCTLGLAKSILMLHTTKGSEGRHLPVSLRDANSREEWLKKHPNLVNPSTTRGLIHYLLLRYYLELGGK